MANILLCTCCKAEITAPQWYNGYPYGYTCISKVSNQKRTKERYQAVEYKVMQGAGTQRQIVRITANGVSANVVIRVSMDSTVFSIDGGKLGSGSYYQDGTLFLSEEKLKSAGIPLTPVTAIQENPRTVSEEVKKMFGFE